VRNLAIRQKTRLIVSTRPPRAIPVLPARCAAQLLFRKNAKSSAEAIPAADE
jgi:hypothetical protein